MRVTHVVASLDLRQGGPARSVLGLAEAQAGLGATLSLVAGYPLGGMGAVTATIDLHHLPHLPGPFFIPGLGLTRRLLRTLRAADLVHVHGTWNGTVILAEWLSRHLHKPFVLSPRGMLDQANVATYSPRLKRLVLGLIERRNLAAVAGWHFLDDSERLACAWLGLNEPPIQALIQPNGLDLPRILHGASLSLPALSGWRPEAFNLLYLGRLHPIKGLEIQVDAVAAMVRAGIPACLHLVGPDDSMAAPLRERAQALGLEERVLIHAPVYGDERYALLRAADAVLLTSHNECNSNTAAETLAVGGLLVGTDTCHLEVPGMAGAALVVPRDLNALVTELLNLAADTDGRGLWRVRAQRYATKQLGWPKLAAQMLAFYEMILTRY